MLFQCSSVYFDIRYLNPALFKNLSSKGQHGFPDIAEPQNVDPLSPVLYVDDIAAARFSFGQFFNSPQECTSPSFKKSRYGHTDFSTSAIS